MILQIVVSDVDVNVNQVADDGCAENGHSDCSGRSERRRHSEYRSPEISEGDFIATSMSTFPAVPTGLHFDLNPPSFTAQLYSDVGSSSDSSLSPTTPLLSFDSAPRYLERTQQNQNVSTFLVSPI